jgi:hypothetical protein
MASSSVQRPSQLRLMHYGVWRRVELAAFRRPKITLGRRLACTVIPVRHKKHVNWDRNW